MSLEADRFKYERSPLSIDESPLEPSYQQFLAWAADAESKALALDIWSRGNYVSYLTSRRKRAEPTVVVPFEYVDELRCYYRRLAFMGVAAHFVYVGSLPIANRYLTLHPADDYLIDAGAGWIAAAGTTVRTRGRNWFPIIGCARLMPEVFAEWLTSEAATSFAQGDTFLSPAELIGIPKAFEEDAISMVADINDATPIFPQKAATELLFNLELPYVDEMDHQTFQKILEDNDHRLQRFRYSIQRLVKGVDAPAVNEAVEELKDEVAQMCSSDRTLRLRQTIAKFGGVFTTFGAGLSAFGSALGRGLVSPDAVGATVTGAATAGAVAALVDIWKQSMERTAKRRENRYSILWDLGVKKPSDLKRKRSLTRIKRFNRVEPVLLSESFDCHWLCKSGGMQFLAVRPASR